MQKTRLRKYARLIARVGINIQKGQDVFVNAGLDQPEFVAMVTDELYKCGARKVFVEFSYQSLEKYHIRHRSIRALSTVETFEEEKMKYEIAEEMGVELGADATARQNGSVGGEITRRLVKLAQGNTNEKE